MAEQVRSNARYLVESKGKWYRSNILLSPDDIVSNQIKVYSLGNNQYTTSYTRNVNHPDMIKTDMLSPAQFKMLLFTAGIDDIDSLPIYRRRIVKKDELPLIYPVRFRS